MLVFLEAFFIVSISTKGIPCLTISPTLMRIFLTSPSTDAGISIAALSVSRIMIESSDSTFCPTSTQTSITSTSSTSPRSGIKGLAKVSSSPEVSFVISSFDSVRLSSSSSSEVSISSVDVSKTSISTKGIPCLTISPTLMRIFLTSPLTEAGISIAALSVSRIIIESSDSTF